MIWPAFTRVPSATPSHSRRPDALDEIAVAGRVEHDELLRRICRDDGRCLHVNRARLQEEPRAAEDGHDGDGAQP
jgi:hypothetical protein